MSAAQFDSELQGLLLDRKRLLEELAPVLSRQRYKALSKPESRAMRKKRRLTRLRLRNELRASAEAIAARCMQLFGEHV